MFRLALLDFCWMPSPAPVGASPRSGHG
jgi:hypothetical protein